MDAASSRAFDSINDYLRNLNEAAKGNGFFVLEYDGRSGGHITLADRKGNEITVRSPYGLDILPYVQQIRAIDRVAR